MNLLVIHWFKTLATTAALLALSMLAGTSRAASINFTLTGTAMSSQYGYAEGEQYTFNWIVNSGFTNNASSYFTSIYNYWSDDHVSEAPIFTDVSGNGLTGSWLRPVLAQNDPYSFIDTTSANHLSLFAGNGASYSIGLQANGVDVYSLTGVAVTGADIFTYPGSYTDPNAYFTGLTGTYILNGGAINVETADGTIGFISNSLTISTIPEPSSALLTGLGLAALVFRRRRHAR